MFTSAGRGKSRCITCDLLDNSFFPVKYNTVLIHKLISNKKYTFISVLMHYILCSINSCCCLASISAWSSTISVVIEVTSSSFVSPSGTTIS